VFFNHGSGSTDAQHTAGQAPVFLKHGYSFLYLCRRDQGLSAGQAPFMLDLLQSEEATKDKRARQHLQFILVIGDTLDDASAALSSLRSLAGIDSHRVAMVGHSFGGQLTLFAAERDATVHGVVTFAAAANSWGHSVELRERTQQLPSLLYRDPAAFGRSPLQLVSHPSGSWLAPETKRRHGMNRQIGQGCIFFRLSVVSTFVTAVSADGLSTSGWPGTSNEGNFYEATRLPIADIFGLHLACATHAIPLNFPKRRVLAEIDTFLARRSVYALRRSVPRSNSIDVAWWNHFRQPIVDSNEGC
jgi:pimeloyl-ACP methyl ester carboxylesterase